MNIKVCDLMTRTNEACYVPWHETCVCKCRLDTGVCNDRKRWNNNNCRGECE